MASTPADPATITRSLSWTRTTWTRPAGPRPSWKGFSTWLRTIWEKRLRETPFWAAWVCRIADVQEVVLMLEVIQIAVIWLNEIIFYMHKAEAAAEFPRKSKHFLGNSSTKISVSRIAVTWCCSTHECDLVWCWLFFGVLRALPYLWVLNVHLSKSFSACRSTNQKKSDSSPKFHGIFRRPTPRRSRRSQKARSFLSFLRSFRRKHRPFGK